LPDRESGTSCESERKTRPDDVLARPKDRIAYEYDFGDGWEHDIVLEAIGPITGDEPRVSDGRRACPPEDVGGIPGFELFLEALGNPRHPRHQEMLEWHGPFDSEAFDITATNRGLRGRRRKRPDA